MAHTYADMRHKGARAAVQHALLNFLAFQGCHARKFLAFHPFEEGTARR
jgi:hypothetical protein